MEVFCRAFEGHFIQEQPNYHSFLIFHFFRLAYADWSGQISVPIFLNCDTAS